MKRERVTQRKYVVDSVGELIRHRREHPKKKARMIPSVAFAVEETVKQSMRQLAQESRPSRNWNDLLRHAIDISRDELLASLSQSGESFDLEPYFQNAQVSLKSVAREIHRLQENLLESRAAKRVHEKVLPDEDNETLDAPFEITPIGLLDSIDGYLASPTSPSGEINLDAISAHFQLEGDWFPYEINVEDMAFVVDDDGSVFVSTENFPREYLKRACETLEQIATLLNS